MIDAWTGCGRRAICAAMPVALCLHAFGQCESAKLLADDGANSDHFGSVSIAPDRILVGAYWNDAVAFNSGSAYVFVRDDSGTPDDPGDDLWLQQAKLVASDGQEGDRFGRAVSIAGDWVVAGAAYHDEYGSNAGAVYVFRREGETWVEEAELGASDATAGDEFGTSVAIIADRLVVGAHGDDDNGDHAGAAYVFRLDDNGTPHDPMDDFWVEQAKLLASEGHDYAWFGVSVSIAGDWVAVGAQDDVVSGIPSGAAYVFWRDDNGTPDDPSDDLWLEQDRLAPPDGSWLDRFGCAVAMSEDRVVVGARKDDDNGDDSGSAYVFRRDDNGTPDDPSDDFWVEEDKLLADDGGAGDWFGNSVAIDGDAITVGAGLHWHDGISSGVAYVFRRDDNGTPNDPSDDFWYQDHEFVPSDGADDDAFGVAVGLGTGWLAVGAYGDDDNGESSGSAYVFDLAGADCNENSICDSRDIADGTSEDENDNGIPDECECAADLDNDGDTDQSDLGILLADWGCDDPQNGCAGDLDADGDTDQADLGVLLSDWGCVP